MRNEKPQDLEALIAQLPVHEQEKLLEQVAEYKAAVEREKCQASFMAFVKNTCYRLGSLASSLTRR